MKCEIGVYKNDYFKEKGTLAKDTERTSAGLASQKNAISVIRISEHLDILAITHISRACQIKARTAQPLP